MEYTMTTPEALYPRENEVYYLEDHNSEYEKDKSEKPKVEIMEEKDTIVERHRNNSYKNYKTDVKVKYLENPPRNKSVNELDRVLLRNIETEVKTSNIPDFD